MFLPVTPKPTKGVKSAKTVFHRTSMKACFIKFNPVEFMWAYMKCILRRLKARTEDALIDAAVQALDCVTPELIVSWFKHCNYTPHIVN